MSVGIQGGKQAWDQNLTDLALAWRALAMQTQKVIGPATAVGTALAFMQAQGYDNTTANAQNPSSQTDAAYAAQLIGYFSTLAGVVQGSATQASQFNFVNAMGPVMAGQNA